MEKENRIVERKIEEKIICHDYDSLVREMAKSMEVDEAKIYSQIDGEFNHEDINSWIGAVAYKDGKSPDIEFSISSDKGKNKIEFETVKMEGIKEPDEETTKEELLYSMALTEAKMRVVKEIAEDTYPAVSYQIEDYRKQMEQVREEVLNNKEDTDTLDELLSRVVSRRGMLLATTMVISSLILSSCGIGAQPVEGYDPTSTGAKATAAESVKQTQVKEAVETMMANAKATETAKPTATATKEPTITPTKEVTPTEAPRQIETNLTGSITEILARVEKLNLVKLEDYRSGVYAEKEMELYKSGEIIPFSDKVVPFNIGDLRRSDVEKNVHTVTLDFSPDVKTFYRENKETIPYDICDFSMTEIGEQKILMIGVKYLNIDGSVSFLHLSLQNYNDPIVQDLLVRMLIHKNEFYPVAYMESDSAPWSYIDYKKEKLIVDLLKTGGPERYLLFKQWKESGIVPEQLQKELLSFCTWPW